MKSCFCGCGRRIPKFPLGMRSINRRGALVSQRLAETHENAGDHPELAGWYTEGEEIVGQIQAAMHGQVDPRSLDERPVREWQRAGREIQASLDTAHGLLGKAVRESGMSPEEAASELGRLVKEEGKSPEEAMRDLGLAPETDDRQ